MQAAAEAEEEAADPGAEEPEDDEEVDDDEVRTTMSTGQCRTCCGQAHRARPLARTPLCQGPPHWKTSSGLMLCRWGCQEDAAVEEEELDDAEIEEDEDDVRFPCLCVLQFPCLT